ncbi:MAG: hypothetical protein A3C74_02820 [Candidatus Magasanikbacteria bacterium RIFCSPHIGHO2_02_FULL_44_13]|nr:MAG: hypothetical protein A3C74_02820 [Candidatus Magasanikbacteria bacterium RIFCSPHIGHO2_02_FULL_44_13]
MKILVINVCLRPYKPQIMFPLGLSYVVGAIQRAGYDFEMLDLDRDRKSEEEIKSFLTSATFDVVALGCIATGYKTVKNLTRIIREVKKGAVIIVGNSVADSIPKLLLEKTEADVAVIGEGEITIVEVLDKIKNAESLAGVKGIWYKEKNEIFSNPPREVIKDINSISFPGWDSFDMEAYIVAARELINDPPPIPKDGIRAFMVNFARGCPFKCSFCYQVFQRNGYRFRSTDSVLEEIKELQNRYKINYIMFNDDLSFLTKKQVEDFVDRVLVEKLKFFWTAICRSNLFNSENDVELLKKIKSAGCIGFGYSLESANEEIRRSMNKMLDLKSFAMQKRLLDKADLSSWTSLVFGYPQETKETIKETMDLCYDLGIYPSSGYLLPMPMTPMYDYIFKNGMVKDEEAYVLSLGDRQDLRINLTKMSDSEFQEEIKKHLERISEKLHLGLKGDELIKTTNYKSDQSKIKQ